MSSTLYIPITGFTATIGINDININTNVLLASANPYSGYILRQMTVTLFTNDTSLVADAQLSLVDYSTGELFSSPTASIRLGSPTVSFTMTNSIPNVVNAANDFVIATIHFNSLTVGDYFYSVEANFIESSETLH